jgi:heterodisulfide reductase subunit D
MRLTTTLPNLRGAISACLKCHGCTYGSWPQNQGFCPIYERGRTFTASAGGLLYLSKAVIDQQMECTKELSELAYTCAACGACDGQCVIVRSINPEMALSDILRLLRYELVKRDVLPEAVRKIYDDVKRSNGANGRAQTLASKGKAPSATVLVAEDVATDTEAASSAAALDLLAKAGKPAAVVADGTVAASTLYDFGFWDQLPAQVAKQAKALGAVAGKELVFVNPHCQEFVTNKAAKVQDDFPAVKGKHISEVLLEALEQGKLKPKKGLRKLRVSYHDPCFLGRGLGVYDPPRQLLAKVNVELVEMERNRDQSLCCGARALGNYFENFSEETAKSRLQEFAETKAEVLITACPSCKDRFGKTMGSDAGRVQDLTEFVSSRVE